MLFSLRETGLITVILCHAPSHTLLCTAQDFLHCPKRDNVFVLLWSYMTFEYLADTDVFPEIKLEVLCTSTSVYCLYLSLEAAMVWSFFLGILVLCNVYF